MTLKEKLFQQIELELEQCDPKQTPYICANISTPEDKRNMVKTIAGKVIDMETTISDAIVKIEMLYNPNMLD